MVIPSWVGAVTIFTAAKAGKYTAHVTYTDYSIQQQNQ